MAKSMKENYPELWAAKEKLEKEKAALVKKAQPLRDQMDVYRAQDSAINAKYRPIRKKYLDMIRPRLPEIDRQLSGLAKAMGGKSLNG